MVVRAPTILRRILARKAKVVCDPLDIHVPAVIDHGLGAKVTQRVDEAIEKYYGSSRSLQLRSDGGSGACAGLVFSIGFFESFCSRGNGYPAFRCERRFHRLNQTRRVSLAIVILDHRARQASQAQATRDYPGGLATHHRSRGDVHHLLRQPQ